MPAAVFVLLIALTGWVAVRATSDAPITTLWVYAHPDDETLTSAGAMLDERDVGSHVVLLLTNGSGSSVLGQPGFPDTPEEIGTAREKESRAALGIMEFDDVRFAGLKDGDVTVNAAEQAIRELVEKVKEEHPDAIVRARGHSPTDSYSPYGDCGHPDHCAAAAALLRVHETGLVEDLRLYRIGHYFDGDRGGSCEFLTDIQQAFKQEMRNEYSRHSPAVGRYGIAANSVPGPWEATKIEPECFNVPSQR